jgi:phosphoglycolate phosphatase
MRLLALFDVDGTLFLTHDPLSSDALLSTLRELYPVDPPGDAVERIDHAGQTAKRIARLVLRAEGLDDAAIDRHLDEWCEAFGAGYVALLATADTSSWQVAPGAEPALSGLEAAGIRLALLTGNPEAMARARMRRLRLERFFPEGRGAFGCDAERRDALIELARVRAGGWPAGQTVEIGDTPRDVETARAAGVRSIAVRSPRASVLFPGADAVCDDLSQAAELLLAWNG